MPTAQAIKNLRLAKKALYKAEREFHAFLVEPYRFTLDAKAEHARLLDKLNQKIADYMDAFNAASLS